MLVSIPRYDPAYSGTGYNSGTGYSLNSFKGHKYNQNTPPPSVTRITPPHHLSDAKLATDV